MILLRGALRDYLALRRALGYKLLRTEKLLVQFVSFLEAAGADRVTTDLAVSWATLPAQGDRSWWAGRLSVVRSFTTYLHSLDLGHEVPPRDLLPAGHPRAVPYLYSAADISALVASAAILSSPLRVLTYQTLIPLLAVTGMRVGEAIRLDRDHLDLKDGRLTVWLSKYGKSRELPLHNSTVDALRSYLHRRDRLFPQPQARACSSRPRERGSCIAAFTGPGSVWSAPPD